KSNTGISNFMKEKQFGNDYGKLESYYFDRLIEAIQSVQPEGYAITPVVSHEVFQNGYRVSESFYLFKMKHPSQISSICRVSPASVEQVFMRIVLCVYLFTLAALAEPDMLNLVGPCDAGELSIRSCFLNSGSQHQG
uniref:Uncharacterized protein n=1 Tax=Trichobilharzia regenti TaxID=157069 RepID=A0AA85J2X7_TRIRE